jgi:hypothetical protein
MEASRCQTFQANIAPSVATQITRQAANRLFSISVSNFMAVLRE